MSDSDASTSMLRFSKKIVATRELIRLVRQKRCLWDRSHPSYRDKAEKGKCWHEIYLEFEPAYDTLNDNKKNLIANTITRKWHNVRDSYVKSRKPGVRRQYVYSGELHFLDPIYLNAKNHDNSTSFMEERMSNDDEGDNESSHNWLNEVFVDIEEEGGENEQNHPPKRPKVQYNKEECDENIVTVLANLIQKEEDEDRAFFKSITPSVKTLSESSKFEFRIQVMKLINNLKIRDSKVVNLKREINSNVDSDSE